MTQLPPEDQAALGEQLDQIQRHIDYHLGKARVTGAAKILVVSTPVRTRVEYICRAFLPPLSRQDGGGLAGAGQSGGRGGGAGLRRDGGQPAGERLQVVRQRAAHLQRRAGGWITLRIGDDGPGMSEDQIAKGGAAGVRLDEKGAGLRALASTSSPISRKPIAAVSSWGGPSWALAASLSLPKVARVE